MIRARSQIPPYPPAVPGHTGTRSSACLTCLTRACPAHGAHGAHWLEQRFKAACGSQPLSPGRADLTNPRLYPSKAKRNEVKRRREAVSALDAPIIQAIVRSSAATTPSFDGLVWTLAGCASRPSSPGSSTDPGRIAGAVQEAAERRPAKRAVAHPHPKGP